MTLSKSAQSEKVKRAETRWRELVSMLDAEMHLYRQNRYRVGEILYHIKVFLKEQKWDKGRRGRWKALVKERFGAETQTADDIVRDYEDLENIPAHKRFYKPRKKPSTSQIAQQNGKNNTVENTALVFEAQPESEAKAVIVASATEDESPEKRGAVECIFVLTRQEKQDFMRAVEELGELDATRLMYEAVVRRNKTAVAGASS
jgi:hypothetical protein